MVGKLIRLAVVIPIVLAALSCGGDDSSDIRKIAKRYLEAWEHHDIETLRAMTAIDVVWDTRGQKTIGRENLLAPFEFDAGAKSVLEFNNIEVRGDTVEFELVEKNELLEALRVYELRHYPRLIFENGLLQRREITRDTPHLREYAEQLSILRSWIRRNRPDVYEKIVTPKGAYRITREAGELLVQMGKIWRESQAVE
ncbi:MAG: nuclear transport factor 2 family protein [Candidatus Latescibacterota bacterium]|nr:MAG: nuclear transport factor 2 family protein [Candidatus Latescibacterota bacterium]